jgi:hypothetical protein
MGCCLYKIGAVVACRWTSTAKRPTHWDSHSKGAPPLARAPSRLPLAPMPPQHITYMFINSLVMRTWDVVSTRLEPWRSVVGAPRLNAQHIGTGTLQRDEPCPTPAPPYPHPAFMLPQPITEMFINGLVIRAWGVVSAGLEQ